MDRQPAQVFEPDNVNHPSHYETGKFECIDVMTETQGRDAVYEFCVCNAFKYLYRHRRKNKVPSSGQKNQHIRKQNNQPIEHKNNRMHRQIAHGREYGFSAG